MGKTRKTARDQGSSCSNSNISNNDISYSSAPSNIVITVYKLQNGKYSLEKNRISSVQSNNNLPFKKKNWVSKIRSHEKTFRNAKNMKNLSKDLIDGISYKIYQDLEAGPSIQPKKKFCDFTGFETNYSEINTGIRFYNSQIYRIFQNMSQPVKDQYLNIRKDLIRLK